MPKFRYTAVDPEGKRTSGVIEAANAGIVADRLQRQRFLLLRTDELSKAGQLFETLQGEISLRRGLSKTVVAHFARELSVMLQAGQDMDHALRFLIETNESARARELLQSLRNRVRGGKSLAASLADYPHVFSRLYVSLVRAGEAGGNLAGALQHLADLLEREIKLQGTIQAAMTYPILLLTASIGTILLLLTYVLPQFTPIFAQAGAQLPLATRILIGAGDFIRDDGGYVILALLVAFLAGYRALREPRLRLVAEGVALKLPLVGLLIRRTQAVRLMRTLGTLLGNGVGLVPALAIGRDVLGSLTAVNAVDKAVSKVRAGERLGAALSIGSFFPLQTIHLIQLGEETGRLADMTMRAANIHDEQVHHTVQRLVSLLVPAVTILMGLVVAGIVGSLLVAMLSLNDLAV